MYLNRRESGYGHMEDDDTDTPDYKSLTPMSEKEAFAKPKETFGSTSTAATSSDVTNNEGGRDNANTISQ